MAYRVACTRLKIAIKVVWELHVSKNSTYVLNAKELVKSCYKKEIIAKTVKKTYKVL